MVQEPQENPAEPTISQADFEKIISTARGPAEAGPSDSTALQAELRKLRGVNAELMREKEEWIRKLKNRELASKAGGGDQEANGEARVRALEVEFGAELARLEGLLTIAELNNGDLSAMKAAPPLKQLAAAGGSAIQARLPRSIRASNTVVVEVHRVNLDAGSFAHEPTTFLSLDFYAHDTQNTYPATGLDVELGWSCEFVVDVDEVLLSYFERESLRVDLMERVSQSVPFRRIASALIDLRPLLEDSSVMDRRRAEFIKDGGGVRIGKADISIRLGQPLGPAVQALREPRAKAAKASASRLPLAPFFSGEKPPYKLCLTIVRAEKVRSGRYGHLPSPYVQYSFPGSSEEPHLTLTVPRTTSPHFGDAKVWCLASEKEVVGLRGVEMDLMVLDDDDEEDDEAGLLGTGKLSLGAFVDKQDGGEVTVPLRGLDGGLSGSLVVAVSWQLAAVPAAAAPAAATAAATTSEKVRAGESARKIMATAPMLEKKAVVREEDSWLQTLSDRFAEFGWPMRKIFSNFDVDGDDEISWDDFKEAIANEPIKLDAEQQRRLFEYWAGDKAKNITIAAFERALKKDQPSKEFKPNTIGILARDLTVTSSKLLSGDLPTRVCVLVDFLKQPPEQELVASRAVPLAKRGSNPARASFSQALSLSLDNRGARARVTAALNKGRGAGYQDVIVMVCPVKDDGHVSMLVVVVYFATSRA